MNKTKQKGINTFIKRLKKLSLVCLEEVNDEFNTDKKYKLQDNDGYLYSLSSMNLCITIRRSGIMAKFFNNNPYTYENVNNYFKLNNIDLELVTRSPQNAIELLEFKCLIHNEIFKRTWNVVSNGSVKCNTCNGITKYNIDSIKCFVESKGCEFISDYYNTVCEDYLFKCNCGNLFKRRMDVFMHKESVNCPECMGINVYTYERVREDLNNHNIELLSKEYKNHVEKLEIKYPCGFITERGYSYIKGSNYECPHCNKKGYKRDTKQFYEEVKNLVGDEYTFEGEYTICDSKMWVIHNECGHRYEITPHKFINGGRRCPLCTGSKCEEIISKHLLSLNVNFDIEYTFEGLFGVNGGLLRFDFAITNNKGKLFLIEYDGEYHYKPIEGLEKLEIQKEHDKRKDNYCKNNNITLYRIPYWEQDKLIEILEEILNKEGLVWEK